MDRDALFQGGVVMNKILTISIAGYNVEKYIRKTLDSILDERIIDIIEIIVVDDGGNDNTMVIVNEYKEKYPNAIIPIHKENGGYGSVLNTSIKVATGKYFKQLDGDDWFDTENLVSFVKLLNHIDVDYVSTPRITVNEKTGEKIFLDFFDYLNEGEYDFSNTKLKNGIGMHTSTFRTTVLKNMKRQITEHCFYTDVELVYFPLPLMKTFYVSHKPVYMYRIGVEGQSVSVSGIKKHYKEHEKVFWEVLSVYQEMGADNQYKKELIVQRLSDEIYGQFIYYCMIGSNKEHKKELKSFYSRVKIEAPKMLERALEKSRIVNLMVKSRFTLYPLLSVLIRMGKRN